MRRNSAVLVQVEEPHQNRRYGALRVDRDLCVGPLGLCSSGCRARSTGHVLPDDHRPVHPAIPSSAHGLRRRDSSRSNPAGPVPSPREHRLQGGCQPRVQAAVLVPHRVAHRVSLRLGDSIASFFNHQASGKRDSTFLHCSMSAVAEGEGDLAEGPRGTEEHDAKRQSTSSPVTNADLKAQLGYLTAFISIVVVGLILAKSGERTTLETVLYMGTATLGSLLVWLSLFSVRTRGRTHEHALRPLVAVPLIPLFLGVPGVFVFVWSLTQLDRPDSKSPPPRPEGEAGVDAGGVTLRNLTIAEGDDYSRIVVTVVNIRQSPVILDQAQFRLQMIGPRTCTDPREIYRLDHEIHFSVGRLSPGLAVLEGPAKEFTVHAMGSLDSVCDDLTLSIEFPLTVALGASETTHIALDIPHRVRAILDAVRPSRLAGTPNYHLGSARDLDINLDLTGPRAKTRVVAEARTRYGAGGTWACVGKRLDGLPPPPALREPCIS